MKESCTLMSRRRFCVGASAGATQLMFATLFDSSQRVPREWKYPYADSHDFPDSGIDASYDKERYLRDVSEKGLSETWSRICRWMLANGDESDRFLSVGNFGELYEEGLAATDKKEKKSSGQYYTPPDVSHVMAEWFSRLHGKAICDVACGVGNLTLAYFEHIGEREAKRILGDGRLYLYDIDETAVAICVTSILVRYGREYADKIHVFRHDFLDGQLGLPPNCKVISNPPYAAVKDIPTTWRLTDVVASTKELYAAFMEKILTQSESSVIITPYSFIGGAKFYPLRRVMNEDSGFVVSFDNVPAAVFNGKKHGIFNSNMGNSVRAAITVADKETRRKGFRFSPLIRFKSTERDKLLKCQCLESLLGTKRQLVTPKAKMFAKCDRRLEHVFDAWMAKSNATVGDYVTQRGRYELHMPNTCRYFTVALDKPLSRKGQISLRFSDEAAYWHVMSMVNSSFAYWYWRLYDGGITYPTGLFLQMPVFTEALPREDVEFCRKIGLEMIGKSDSFVITKANVGVQENVKFPRRYRDGINRRYLDVLGIADDEKIFDIVHSNMALEINV